MALPYSSACRSWNEKTTTVFRKERGRRDHGRVCDRRRSFRGAHVRNDRVRPDVLAEEHGDGGRPDGHALRDRARLRERTGCRYCLSVCVRPQPGESFTDHGYDDVADGQGPGLVRRRESRVHSPSLDALPRLCHSLHDGHQEQLEDGHRLLTVSRFLLSRRWLIGCDLSPNRWNARRDPGLEACELTRTESPYVRIGIQRRLNRHLSSIEKRVELRLGERT